MASAYLHEVRQYARPLFAATLGLAFGLSVNNYTSSLFGAHLIKAFGWARSDFAILGTFAILMLATLPLAGRLADRYGVRKAAAIGIFGMPVTFVGLAMMTGDIRQFFALNIAQILIASFTTSTVYNRVVAERFVSARGVAFAIVMSGPPLMGAAAAPILGEIIDGYGWRVGYWALAGITLAMGIVALLLLPPTEQRQSQPPRLFESLKLVSRSRPFWLIAGSMFLVNLPQALGASQLMIMLADNGVDLSQAWFLSLYPIGVTLGRFIFGYALDRHPPHLVGALGLTLPALGFFYLAGPDDTQWLLAAAILIMGLAQGAEGDVAAYLVGRHFPVSIFASVVGLVGAAVALGASVGSMILSPMLALSGDFGAFLIFSAAVTLLGAAMLVPVGAGTMRVLEDETA